MLSLAPLHARLGLLLGLLVINVYYPKKNELLLPAAQTWTGKHLASIISVLAH